MDNRDTKIAEDLLGYSKCAGYTNISTKPDFSSWGLPAEVVSLLQNDPNAFFIAVLFDRMVRWESAWLAPWELKNRLGHLDVRRIGNMAIDDLSKVIGKGKSQKSLVRFPTVMAKTLISACKRLQVQYSANASSIWKNASAQTIIRRFSEFDGISQKIANMATRFLGLYYGVPLHDWNKIDIAVDRHVARVFLRTGLVKPVTKSSVQSVASLKDQIVQKARLLSPTFPGALDEPTFEVGRYWCEGKAPYCNDSEEPCPLNRSCRRLIAFDVK